MFIFQSKFNLGKTVNVSKLPSISKPLRWWQLFRHATSMKKLAQIFSFVVFNLTCYSQVLTDTTTSRLQPVVASQRSVDTTFWQTENKTKNSFWGNSTYISASINFAKNKEYDFNLGRTKGVASYSERGLGNYSISSWGIAYGLTNTSSQTKQTIKAFYEYNFFPFIIIGNFGVRGEYIYNITDRQSYLRPAIGLSFIYVDIAYNYSFLLNGRESENLYRHGFSVRFKYYLTMKNWERNYFIRQSRR